MKPLFVLSCLLLHTTLQALAQPNQDARKVDSLTRLLPVQKPDSSQVKLMGAIMLAHVYHKPEKGITYKESGLALAQKINWPMGLAIIHQHAGRLYWRLGQFGLALQHHHMALQGYTRLKQPKLQGRVLVEIGQDYLDAGNYAQAEKVLQQSLRFNQGIKAYNNLTSTYDILCYLYELQRNYGAANQAAYDFLRCSEINGDPVNIVHSAQMLASSYLALGNQEEALKYQQLGLIAAKHAKDEVEELNLHLAIGTALLTQKNYPLARNHYDSALAIAVQLNDLQFLGLAQLRMGQFFQQRGQLAPAIQFYQEAEKAFVAIRHKQDLAGLYAALGLAYTQLQQFQKARWYYDKSNTLYTSLNSKMAMADYYDGRQKLDSATGQWMDAYRHFKAYVFIRDSANSKASLQKLVSAQFSFENEKKETQAKAAQQRKDLLAEAELKRQQNLRNASFAVLGVVLLFSLITLHQRNKLAKEKKRSDRLLQDKELLLREIHHRVKNNLEVVSSLLALQSAQISDATTKEAMQESQNRVLSIGIVHQKLYQGASLGAIEMKDYFINLGESILDSFGAENRVSIHCAMDALEVDIDTAVPLGLIVNELITNALKYAFPHDLQGRIRIRMMRKAEGILHLEVSDDGVGKSAFTKGTGFGSQLISLLTQQLNGTMQEESRSGTSIFFDFKTGKSA